MIWVLASRERYCCNLALIVCIKFFCQDELGHAPTPQEYAEMMAVNNNGTLLGKRNRMWLAVASKWGIRGRSEHYKLNGNMFHFTKDHATQRNIVRFDKFGRFKNSGFRNQVNLPHVLKI